MKEVLKVSIARVSFTLEREGYMELEQYLNRLREYYRGETGKDEILDDIEERVSELIVERGGKDRVVTLEDISAIIGVLGKPYENEGAFEGGASAGGDKIKKTFYRDPDNGVLGGVCSGFAAYSGMDVVWARLLYILFFVVMSAPLFAIRHFLGIRMGGVTLMALVYVVLWIIIPPARTVAQKCAMHGFSPTVDEIQRRFREGIRSMGNEARDLGHRGGRGVARAIGRAITFFVGLVLVMIGISGLVAGWAFLLGVDLFSGVSPIGFIDYFQLNLENTLWIKITALLTYFLPFIGMLYGGITMCFGFKSPRWRPGLIIFIIWVISGIVFISLSAIACRPYYRHNDTTQTVPLVKSYDTVYVKYPRTLNTTGAKMHLRARRSGVELCYVKKLKKQDLEFTAYPDLYIYRQSADELPRIDCKMNYFTSSSIFDDRENILTLSNVLTVKDSLITVKPQVYSKQHKFEGQFPSLRLFIPEKTVVILQEPIEHNFNTDHYYSSSDFRWWF